MYKKSILSLAIASTLTLTGCLENNKLEDENTGVSQSPFVPSSDVYPVFNPTLSLLPIPNDAIFQKDDPDTTDVSEADGTFEVSDTSPPVTTALNSLSGASTTAPIDIALSGLVDPDTVDGSAITIIGENPAPNPNQSVFLLELEYASGNALQALANSEPPNVISPTGIDYNAKAITLDGTSTIRINPLKPLNPLSRYIVVITNKVHDETGNPLAQSPGVGGYAVLTNEDTGLADPALSPLKDLINKLWEPAAVGYFNAATNQTRSALSLDSLTADNIALSYSFTTSADRKVVNYIADPASWFTDQLNEFVGLSAAKAIVDSQSDLNGDGKVDFADTSLAVAGAKAAFPANPSDPEDTTVSDALSPLEAAFPLFGCTDVTAGTDYMACIGAALAGLPTSNGGFANLLPTPTNTTVTFDDTTTVDINSSSSITGSLGIPNNLVSLTQGTLTIPYYNGIPAGSNGAPLITDNWVADDVLAGAINTAFAPLGLKIPQADSSVSTVVNYIFPFPKKMDDVTIPIIAMHPTTRSAPGTPMKTAIFQHGITTDRTAAIPFSASLVAGSFGLGTDLTVIAIDQPLHGVAGISSEEQEALATKLLAAAETIDTSDGINPTEQGTIDAVLNETLPIGVLQQVQAAPCPALTGLDLSGATPADIGTALTAVTIGNCGPDAQSQLAGAQTLVSTVKNGGSFVAGLAATTNERHFDFTSAGSGVAPVAMNFTGSNTTNASGSMFINLSNFLTSRDNLRQQVVDLLTLRKSIGSMDLNPTAADGADLDASDVYFFGHSLGTVNGIPFVSVANTTATTSDDIVAANFLTPGGGIMGLIENSPSLSTPVLAGLAAQGLEQDNASFHSFSNIFQAAVDSTDSISFVQDFSSSALNIPVLFTEVLGDLTIPNNPGTTPLGNAFPSHLGGTEPLALHSGAVTIDAATAAAAPQQTVALGQSIVRFTEGFHGTPVFPSSGTDEEAAAFAEMVGQGVSMLLSNGTAVTVTNTDVID